MQYQVVGDLLQGNFLTEVRYLRLPDVKHMTSIGKTTIYYLMRRGEFPDSVRLLPNTVVWKSDEVQEWIKQTSKRARAVGLGISDQRTTATSEHGPSDN